MAQKPGELNNIETSGSAANSEARNPAEAQTFGADDAADNETFTAPEIAEDPDEIRQQIEETRASMSETIDAIGEKLSFANISEQVKEQVSEQIDSAIETVKGKAYEATVGKAETFMKSAGILAENFMKNAGDAMKNTSQKISKSQFYKTAQDSPLPLLLIGLGVGLLAYRSFGGKKQSSHHVANGGSNYKKRSFQSSETEKSALGSAQEKIGDAVSGAYQSVSGTASQAYRKVGDLGTAGRKQYENYLEEKPLVVGAVAAIIGATVALAIPATRYEDELMGEARQNLVQKVEDSTGDLVGKVKDFVNDAGKTIGDEVKNQISAQQK